MTTEPLLGAWTLRSARFEFEDGSEGFDIYGPEPTGRIIFTPDSKMIVLMTGSARKTPTTPEESAAAFGSMMAYSGPFKVSGPDTIVTEVDVSQHPAWVGTEQARHFAVEGSSLAMWSEPWAHPAFDQRVGVMRLQWTHDA